MQEAWNLGFVATVWHWKHLAAVLLKAGCPPLPLAIAGLPGKALVPGPPLSVQLPGWAREPLR